MLSSVKPAIEKRIEKVNKNSWKTTILSIYKVRVRGNNLRSLLLYISTEVAEFFIYQMRIIHEELDIDGGYRNK